MGRNAAAIVVVVAVGCDADSPRTVGAPPPTAPTAPTPAVIHFRGTRDTTPRLGFGGKPYCGYDVAMRDVVVDVTARLPVTAPGDVVDARVTSLMVEGLAEACPGITPAHPSSHVHARAPGEVVTRGDDGGLVVRLAPEPSNHPAARAQLTLKLAGEGILATVRWQRTDQPPPLDWTIVTDLTLSPVR